MRKQILLPLIISVAAVLLVVAITTPFLATSQYRAQARQTLVTLRDQYNKNQAALRTIDSLPLDQRRSLATQALQPFQDAAKAMPSLTPLGPLGWWNKSYTDALQTQQAIAQTINKGAAYSEAFQQLMDFYQKSQTAIQNTGANSQTVAGLHQTATEYRTVASLRQQIVASATLDEITKDYIATLNSAATLFDQKASALQANDTQTILRLDAQLLQIGYHMSVLASTDTPKDMNTWLPEVQPRINTLITEVQ